jgi:hypothetical protein
MIKEEWTNIFIKKEFLRVGAYGKVYLAIILVGKRRFS